MPVAASVDAEALAATATVVGVVFGELVGVVVGVVVDEVHSVAGSNSTAPLPVPV